MFEKNEYTIDDFESPVVGGLMICETAQSYSNLNYSSILTKLIQEAGRWCKRYASDLFIDWQSMLDDIVMASLSHDSCFKTYLFGFRESGVDHDKFIFSRYLSDRTVASYEYRAIWRINVGVYRDGSVTMKLYEVNR